MPQQSVLTLTIQQLGMSLITMQTNAGVRLLDDLNITLALESRQSVAHQMTSIELDMTPVVLRASLVDINLITAIITHAANLYAEQNKSAPASTIESSARPSATTIAQSQARSRTRNTHTRARSSLERPEVHISREKVCCYSFFGQYDVLTEFQRLAQGSL